MKLRTKVLLGVTGVLILFCGAGSWVVASNFRQTTMALQGQAVDEGDYIMETLGKTWSTDALRDVASADFLVTVPEESEKKAWLDKMKKELGAYKTGVSTAEKVLPVKDIDNKDVLGVIYVNEAEFEKKKAKVRLQMILRDRGGWQMASMDIDPEK